MQLKAAALTAPDFARLTVEFAYGDIIARDGLALDLRQVVTVSALLGHRNAERQLRDHMLGYLNVVGEPRTLVELLFVAIAVLGFPVAIHAITLVRDIFKERGVVYAPPAVPADDGTERQRQGYALMATMLTDAHATHEHWAGYSATFAPWLVEFEYGARPRRDHERRDHEDTPRRLAMTGSMRRRTRPSTFSLVDFPGGVQCSCAPCVR